MDVVDGGEDVLPSDAQPVEEEESDYDDINSQFFANPLEQWRKHIDREIEAKKAHEQQQLEIAIEKGAETLKEWRKQQDEALEKLWQEYCAQQDKNKVDDKQPFSWPLVLDYLEKHASSNPHASKNVSKAIELIKNKCKNATKVSA